MTTPLFRAELVLTPTEMTSSIKVEIIVGTLSELNANLAQFGWTTGKAKSHKAVPAVLAKRVPEDDPIIILEPKIKIEVPVVSETSLETDEVEVPKVDEVPKVERSQVSAAVIQLATINTEAAINILRQFNVTKARELRDEDLNAAYQLVKQALPENV